MLLQSELAKPLTMIYNACLAWKRKVVVPIPKVQAPTNYKDLRPVSMSPLWSKLLEIIVYSSRTNSIEETPAEKLQTAK